MNSTTPSTFAAKLVQAFAAIESTEGLIIHVAGADNMLAFCQELLELYDRDSQAPLVQQVNTLCVMHGVLPGVLYAEVRKMLLALNHFHNADQDHFAALGLQPDATREEVKQTYRALSKQYHPDSLNNPGSCSQKFMEIAGAYHAIMAGTTEQKTSPVKPWREKKHTPFNRRRRDQKFFIAGVLFLICLLATASIFLAARYNHSVMLSQYKSKGHSPKQSKITAAKENTPPPSPAATVLSSTPAALLPAMHDIPDREPEVVAAIPEAKPKPPRNIVQQKQDTETDIIPVSLPAPDPQPPVPAPHRDKTTTPPDQPPPAADSKPAAVIAANDIPGKSQVKSALQGTDNSKTITPTTAEPIPTPRKSNRKQELQKKTEQEADTDSHEIETLVNQYCKLYGKKDLPAFLALFADQAIENGQPITSLTEQYQSLFAHTQEIDLRILNMNWQGQQDELQAKGNFKAAYTYKDGRTKEHTGNITFLLIREQGGLKIQDLEYVFAE